MRQRAIPFHFLRGGTSRGPYFHRSDLPEDREALAQVLIAALGAATPDTTYLFFALAQFPIYLMPQIVKRFSRRYVVAN